jgi:hypothetical protein
VETIFHIILWNDRKINRASRWLTPLALFQNDAKRDRLRKSRPRGNLAVTLAS